MISPRTFFRSLRHAFRGLADIFRAEQSFRIQTLFALLVIALVIVLPLEVWERILLLLLTAAVVILEIINTIIERVADAVQPRLSPMVREVKDMMAGAVFLSALVSAVIGAIILYRPFYDLLCDILSICKA